MKRLILCLFAIALTWQLSLQAEDFIKKVDVPSQWYADVDWCSFNDVGYSLPVFTEKTSNNNLYVTIYNNDWTVKRIFNITGLNETDKIIILEARGEDGNEGYKREFRVSQYFFNDDDKYEIVIGSPEGSYAYTNVRVINDDGVVIGHLTNFSDPIPYRSIRERHYIRNDNDEWYSFPGQTGAPLMKHSNDTNGDGVVNAADVTSVYNEILGQ